MIHRVKLAKINLTMQTGTIVRHRIVDGAEGAGFLRLPKKLLENPPALVAGEE
jgi:pyruvate/2-oxoglutarate dehydrogenase complex dihydrolipoamide acyltransferase (E2) component